MSGVIIILWWLDALPTMELAEVAEAEKVEVVRFFRDKAFEIVRAGFFFILAVEIEILGGEG